MFMEKLVCECCGGTINRSTMICEFCGTKYKRSEYEIQPIRIETYRNPVQTLRYGVDISEMVEYGLSSAEISEIAMKEICDKLSEQIAPYIQLRTEEHLNVSSYPFRRKVINGELKLIQPIN